jgi:hypothetical protein
VQYIISLKLILLQTGDDGPATGLDTTGPLTQMRGAFEVSYDHEEVQNLSVDEAEIEPFKAFEEMKYNSVVAELTKRTTAKPIRVRSRPFDQ